MTPNEVEKLAGHRTVSPWVMKLVLEAVELEREACAKVCEAEQFPEIEDESCEHYNIGCRHSAAAIRARGE